LTLVSLHEHKSIRGSEYAASLLPPQRLF